MIGGPPRYNREAAITQQPWVTIDASRKGEVRLALIDPRVSPRPSAIRCYEPSALPTFTDAVIRFQDDMGIDLRRMDAALAIAGAVSGDAIPVARSRWTISRTGLAALFRRSPVIVNDMAARAWGLHHPTAAFRTLRGLRAPDLGGAGRYVFVALDEGVGGAAIEVDATGAIRVVESEGGHLDFSPVGSTEGRLAALFANDGMPPSWEQLLMIDRGDPRVQTAMQGLSDAERNHIMAAMLGRFAVNMALAGAAWRGVVVGGRGAERILANDARSGFDASFQHRRTFRRLVAGLPCWLVEQADPVLHGLAALVAERERTPAPR